MTYICTHETKQRAPRKVDKSYLVVSIWQLLDELSGKFGDRFPVSPDTYEVLDLIETLVGRPARRSGPRYGIGRRKSPARPEEYGQCAPQSLPAPPAGRCDGR